MNTSVHLVSMPMHDPLHPSCQLGYLEAYLRQTFPGTVPVCAYSAHLQVLYDVLGERMNEFFLRHRLFGEEFFFLVCSYVAPRSKRMFDRALDRYNARHPSEIHVSKETVAAFAQGISCYIEKELIPCFRNDGLNIVGLTTTFAQVFASIFTVNYIRKHSGNQVLFVFGGASMSLPEATLILQRWGVSGLIVTGSGEIPLAQIVQSCLDSDSGCANDIIEAVHSKKIVNVTKIGLPRTPIDLNMSKSFLESVPDPDYDEFFANLRSLCEDEHVFRALVDGFVSIPLEGSRGCFARCDFCQNPNITSQFRTLKGQKVAERSLRVCSRYGKRHVFFTDSVCNSWAEEYADVILGQDDRIAAFMEMRVHAPERFWTKLAASGVTEVQLGIEAVSETLLKAIGKGTTVIQNLRAAKYLAELGVRSLSNLITHHPKSSTTDVDETMRIVRLLEHFPEFCLSPFVVSYASPVYNELGEDQKTRLVRGFEWLPMDLRKYSFPRDLAYSYPEEWLDPAVVVAWDEFRDWYESDWKRVTARRPTLSVNKKGREELVVVDTRFRQNLCYTLEGPAARILNLCHAGVTVTEIVDRTGLGHDIVRSNLRELLTGAILIEASGRYLSLPLRPRQELLDNLQRRSGALSIRGHSSLSMSRTNPGLCSISVPTVAPVPQEAD